MGTGELSGALNTAGKALSESPVSARDLGGLVGLVTDGTISGKLGKEVFAKMFDSGRTASAIIEAEGLKQISDTGELEKLIDEVIAGNQNR